MADRRRSIATREDKLFEGREIRIEELEPAFQLLDVPWSKCRPSWYRELTAQIEQILLNLHEALTHRGRKLIAEQ